MAASDGDDVAANLSPAMLRSEMDAFLLTIGAKATPFSVSDMFAGAKHKDTWDEIVAVLQLVDAAVAIRLKIGLRAAAQPWTGHDSSSNCTVAASSCRGTICDANVSVLRERRSSSLWSICTPVWLSAPSGTVTCAGKRNVENRCMSSMEHGPGPDGAGWPSRLREVFRSLPPPPPRGK